MTLQWIFRTDESFTMPQNTPTTQKKAVNVIEIQIIPSCNTKTGFTCDMIEQSKKYWLSEVCGYYLMLPFEQTTHHESETTSIKASK